MTDLPILDAFVLAVNRAIAERRLHPMHEILTQAIGRSYHVTASVFIGPGLKALGFWKGQT